MHIIYESNKQQKPFILHSNSSVDDSYYVFIATLKRRLRWLYASKRTNKQTQYSIHQQQSYSSQRAFSEFHGSTQHFKSKPNQTEPIQCDINRIHIYFIKCSIIDSLYLLYVRSRKCPKLISSFIIIFPLKDIGFSCCCSLPLLYIA